MDNRRSASAQRLGFRTPTLNAVQASKPARQTDRGREREIEQPFWLKYPFAWGTVAPPGIGGTDVELARGCTPWESFRCFSQQCVSHTPAASVFKWPLLLGSLAPPLQCANTVKFAPFELHATVGDLGVQRSPTASPLNLRDIAYSALTGIFSGGVPRPPRQPHRLRCVFLCPGCAT